MRRRTTKIRDRAQALRKPHTVIIFSEKRSGTAANVTARLLALVEMGDEPVNFFISNHLEVSDSIHNMIHVYQT